MWLAKLASSAPEAVTTTQCGVVCSRPPPAPSSWTRRPTVRSQSLATLQRIVCSYLLPGIRLLRSAPASLCRVMAQAAWPSGAASLMHESRQRPTTFAPPLSCLMLPPPGAGHHLPTRPVSVSGAGPPRLPSSCLNLLRRLSPFGRLATCRPAPLPLTSHAHRF